MRRSRFLRPTEPEARKAALAAQSARAAPTVLHLLPPKNRPRLDLPAQHSGPLRREPEPGKDRGRSPVPPERTGSLHLWFRFSERNGIRVSCETGSIGGVRWGQEWGVGAGSPSNTPRPLGRHAASVGHPGSRAGAGGSGAASSGAGAGEGAPGRLPVLAGGGRPEGTPTGQGTSMARRGGSPFGRGRHRAGKADGRVRVEAVLDDGRPGVAGRWKPAAPAGARQRPSCPSWMAAGRGGTCGAGQGLSRSSGSMM
mgnify:CR=1 FL=1